MTSERFRIVIHLSESLANHLIWNLVYPILKKLVLVSDEYEATMNTIRSTKSLTEISEYFSHKNSEDAFMLTKGENSIQHFISYFEIDSQITISLPTQDLLCSINHLTEELINRTQITNTIVNSSSYLRNQHHLRTPPITNLFLASGLSNSREYYIEGVSADMWLGEPFWQHAACTKAELLAQDWLNIRHLEKGVIHVNAYPEPFTTAEGEQGKIQRRLLKLLFNIDENRPCSTPPPPPPPEPTPPPTRINWFK